MKPCKKYSKEYYYVKTIYNCVKEIEMLFYTYLSYCPTIINLKTKIDGQNILTPIYMQRSAQKAPPKILFITLINENV